MTTETLNAEEHRIASLIARPEGMQALDVDAYRPPSALVGTVLQELGPDDQPARCYIVTQRLQLLTETGASVVVLEEIGVRS